jgi:small-conductance mechanosensitive channel
MTSRFKIAFIFIGLLFFAFATNAKASEEIIINTAGDTIVLETIPLSHVTSRLEKDYNLLKEIDKYYQSDLKIDEFDSIFESSSADLERKKIIFEKEKTNYSSRQVNNALSEWNTYEKLAVNWRDLINSRITQIEKDLFTINIIVKEWELTLAEARKTKAPPSVVTNIKEILSKVKEKQKSITKLHNDMLRRQGEISKITLLINDVIQQLNEVEKDLQSDYFIQDSPRIWQVGDSTVSPTLIKEHFIQAIHDNNKGMRLFFVSNEETIYLHILIFLIVLLAFYFLRKQSMLSSAEDNEHELQMAHKTISWHILPALVISLFLSIWLYSDLNSTIGDLIQLIYIILAIIFLPDYINKNIRPTLYAILALFLLNQFQIFFPAEMLFSRLILFLKAFLSGWIIYKILDKDGLSNKELLRNKMGVVLFFMRLFGIFLIVSVFGNIFGNLGLSILLCNAVVNSIINIILFLMVVIVANRTFLVLLRTKFVRKSNFISNNWQLAEKRLTLTVFILAFYLWVKSILNSLNLVDPIVEWFSSIIETTWKVGDSTIELGGILGFFLVILLTYIVYRIIKTLLETELFPRVKLPRGVPGAISMITGYVIVAYGIYLALAAAKVDLGKFGLMAGALGVGIGFGLQNIVANFIAGLILAFERPIQVGDTIEAGTVMGDVKHIGVRACTIRTFDGSEVMIPNGNLIANDVINWTLSDRKKRRDIFVSVAYGNNPHKVLEIIKKVGEENPNVLQVPAPWALFEGFGESSLKFRLRIWTAMDVGLTTKSEVAMGIYDALSDAGIEIPFPQHDLHVKSVDPTLQKIIMPGIKKNKPKQ